MKLGYERMFRTGDYARIIGGQLVYEGRSDSQVKVRGHRVDLSEVYNSINQLPEVSVCVVLCYKPGEPEQVNQYWNLRRVLTWMFGCLLSIAGIAGFHHSEQMFHWKYQRATD